MAASPGVLCLQGGAEFGRACLEMDHHVVSRAPVGPVVVLPAAAAPGREYVTAARNAARHYRRWVGDDVRLAPDPREDPGACAAALGDAGLVVLPGGSPSRLLAALQGEVGAALVARWRAGAAVSGASAGAMVLCERTLLPEDGAVADGLGLVEGLALPHWSGTERWADRYPGDLVRWGLPECGGVLVDGDGVRAVGAGEAVRITADGVAPLPR